METLTTKNLELGERCGELEATVADLESSVQLSEELELQQAEDVRELQVCTRSRSELFLFGYMLRQLHYVCVIVPITYF